MRNKAGWLVTTVAAVSLIATTDAKCPQHGYVYERRVEKEYYDKVRFAKQEEPGWKFDKIDIALFVLAGLSFGASRLIKILEKRDKSPMRTRNQAHMDYQQDSENSETYDDGISDPRGEYGGGYFQGRGM